MTMGENKSVQVNLKGGGSIIKYAPIFSSDGQYIFIIWKNVIKSYNVQTGERFTDFTGCDDNVIGAVLHPQNPMLLVACSSSGEIVVWKWKTALLLTKSKIKHDINEVHIFHLLRSDNKSDSTDCEALLFYSKLNKYNIGLFSLKDFTLIRDFPIIITNNILSLQVGGAVDSQFIGILNKNELLAVKLNSFKRTVRCMTKGSLFTSIACHPEQECIATGDNFGRIFLWHRLFSKGSPTKALYHWHTLPVNVLNFSQSGTYMYSGGNECVLVKWRVDNLEKNFLPRLSAPIMHLTSVQGNTYMAISTKNNALHIIDAKFKIRRVIQLFTWAVSVDVGIKVDDRTKSLVLNGNVGNIQFYCPHTKSLLYNLDIVGQNKLTEERNINISNTNVNKIALTKNGDWLACIEERCDNETYHEIRLKFFQFDEVNQQYTLNTSIEYPHENGVTSLEFQPSSNSSDLLCATTGNDNQFKIWNLVDTANIYSKGKSWRCLRSAYYKNLPANSISFSMDGSLLAVGFGPCLTAWTPDTCDLKCSLLHPNFKEMLLKVQFGNVDQCHIVVAMSSERICVWNLLTLALVWTVPIKGTHLCADPLSTYMAIFSEQKELFIFTPASSNLIYHQKQLNEEKIIAAAFVPRLIECSSSLHWQNFSQLYFIDSNQELFCLETENETTTLNALEYSAELQRSAFSDLIAETTTSATDKCNSYIDKDIGLRGATSIKQFINPPVHTMPPMRVLCDSVLRSMIIRNGTKASFEEGTNDNKDKDESSEEIKQISDSEIDSTPKRRSIKKLKAKTKSKVKNENLKSVLSEQFKWTSSLLD